MPFTLIAGDFRIRGAAPDGDSVRFHPRVDRAFERAALRVRTNRTGGAQLRLDGIDALETHYAPQPSGLGTLRQPAEFGDAAAAHLVQMLGFTGVRRDARELVTSARPDSTPGYILTRFADDYGRCVAFVFVGEPPEDDLAEVFLTTEQIKTSVNVTMLAEGLAYPTYYSKLFPDLRQVMTSAVSTARDASGGLWPRDRTAEGFTVLDLGTITDEVVILPKLFRRLADYLALNDADPALDGLPAFLASREDRLVIISEGRFTGFDNTVEVDGQQVRLRYPAEDLVFIEK